MTLEKLRVMIQAEIKPYQDALKQARNETSSATNEIVRQTSKVKSTFSTLGKFIAGLAIGRVLIGFGKSAIRMASDIQEVQNVVDTAFGSMAYKCEAFAKTAIKQFGMSELSAKQTASTYMAMARGIGMASGQASDMAIKMAGLSGDVASFFNISQSEASTKLKSVFTGETETLKDLGVVMTQTNLKQYAMSHGMGSNIEKMDQATLTMLRYKFVMEQLAMANGDFAKTSGSWANQVRILQEQWKQLLGIIGNGLMAVLTPVVNFLNQVMGKLIQLANTASAVISAIFGKGKAKKEKSAAALLASDANSATDAQTALGNSLDDTSKKAKKAAKEMRALGGFDELNIIQPKGDKTDSNGAGAGGASSVPIASGDYDLGEPDTSGVSKAVEKVMDYINKLKTFLEKNKVIITSLLAGLLAGLTTFALIKNFDKVMLAISAITSPLKTLFTSFQVFFMGISEGSGVMTTLSAIFGTTTAVALVVAVAVAAITAALVYLWQTSEQFRNIVTGAINALFEILQNFYNTVLKPLFAFLLDVFNTVIMPIAMFLSDVFVTAVDVVMSIVLSFWKSVLAPLVDFLVSLLAIALQGVIDIWEAWKPAIELVYAAVKWIWDSILKPIVIWIKDFLIKRFDEFGNFINELIPSIMSVFKGLIDFFVGIFTLDINKCWDGITGIFQGFDDFLSNIFSTDWTKHFGVLGVVFNEFFKTIKSIWDLIKGVFKAITDFVSGKFNTDWKAAWDGVKMIFKGLWESLKGIVKTAWDAILGLFSNGGKIFSGVVDSIAGVFKTIVNCIIDGLNKVIAWPFDKINQTLNGIRDIDIPLIGKPFAGLWEHNPIYVPQIPRLARGGVIDQATLAMVGEAGKEVVMPLENNTGWIETLASKISGFGGDNQKLDKMIDLLSYLIQVVDEKELCIGDRDIGEANKRYKNRKGVSFSNI